MDRKQPTEFRTPKKVAQEPRDACYKTVLVTLNDITADYTWSFES